jgi:adenylate cyclase
MKKASYLKTKGKSEFDELFNQEVETSERLRTGILIGLLGLEGIMLLIIYLFYKKEYFSLFTSQIALYAVLIFMVIIVIYELILHYYWQHCRKSTNYNSALAGYLNAFFEISLLSLLLVFIIQYSDQVIILHTPAALTYFVFIILATLRLDFKLAIFTGLFSALEYIIISLYFYNYFAQSETSGLLHTNIQILGQGLMLIIAGIASGFVASLLKKKMLASFFSIKEKNEVIDLFGQQISPQIAHEILNDKSGHTGRRQNVCIMFLDIRGFTPFSEYREPEEVVAYLNSLFGFMIEIVQTHNGIINQFLGDGFMATFGAPVSDHDSRKNAIKASLEIISRKNIETENKTIPPTRIGIGIHYGEAVTGNIGSEMRKQYSITGSVVNIASRIESLTKRYNTEVLASEEVISHLNLDIREEFNSLGLVKVKGSKKLISLYNLKKPVQ